MQTGFPLGRTGRSETGILDPVAPGPFAGPVSAGRRSGIRFPFGGASVGPGTHPQNGIGMALAGLVRRKKNFLPQSPMRFRRFLVLIENAVDPRQKTDGKNFREIEPAGSRRNGKNAETQPFSSADPTPLGRTGRNCPRGDSLSPPTLRVFHFGRAHIRHELPIKNSGGFLWFFDGNQGFCT